MLLGDQPAGRGQPPARAVRRGSARSGRTGARYDDDASLLDDFAARPVQLTGERPNAAREVRARGGRVGRPARSLSPGERTRARLAELQARGVNLLVLDEPTNHLDLEAIEQLELALADYPGSVVVVSHDRRFLERITPGRRSRWSGKENRRRRRSAPAWLPVA